MARREMVKVKTHPWRGGFLWLVRDSNPRSLRRLIYSQIPLAAWVTSQCAFGHLCGQLTERTSLDYPKLGR